MANNQGGLMLVSTTPERSVTNATCTATFIRPSHPIHLGTTDVRRMAKLKSSTPMPKISTYPTPAASQLVRASAV